VIITVTLNPSLDRTLTVPCITFGGVLRATASRLDWGGKGFNASRALQALGTESVTMGLVGGPTGQVLERGLCGMGIATDLMSIAGETRTNVVVTEAEGERYVKVNEPGPAIHKDELAVFLDRVSARVCPGDLWILSGSLPPGVPPGFYARLVRLVQAQGARALLDASGEPLRLGCAASPYLVKPNAVEAAEMTGLQIQTDSDAFDAARAFLGHGVEYVALSLGARGLLLASAQQVVRAKPPRVQARNPVGAGDALLSGLAWALERDLSLEEMARWGVAAGTAAAMHEGVSTGTRAEVQALHDEIQAETLNVCLERHMP
jgi:1-phosphofructokinase family hexose kinase